MCMHLFTIFVHFCLSTVIKVTSSHLVTMLEHSKTNCFEIPYILLINIVQTTFVNHSCNDVDCHHFTLYGNGNFA